MKSTAGFALVLMLLIGRSTAGVAETARPDLTGRVTHEDGSAVAKATVFIYTAGPKEGMSSLCPSCYADCSKKAQTDPAGRFEITSLDPKLQFRLLVVAPGHESRFVAGVDPVNGPQQITLKERNADEVTSKTRIAGMVMGPDGRPVVGAIIGPEGVQRGLTTQWGGIDRYVDPVAVADDRGQFLLPCQEGVDAVEAVVEGPGVAKRWVELKPGRDHLVRMEEGVAVTGRIERDGRFLKDVVVGLVTTDRACGNFLRCDELATDKDGRFLILNVPPNRDFLLYARMDSLTGRGALPSKAFRTGASGSISDLHALAIQRGFRLKGRVVLSDGKAIPPGAKMVFGRDEAWDAIDLPLDPEGRFEMTDVPAGAVHLGIRIKGYKLSKRNPNLDWYNGSIIGRIKSDIADFVLLLEPGQWHPNEEKDDAPAGTDLQPGDQPLRSPTL